MSGKDVWYFEVETSIDGERRRFSRSVHARPPRHGENIPPVVESACREFLSDVVAMSDLHTYDAVRRGERYDWPYRSASYLLSRNATPVVRSFAVKPIKPEYTEDDQ